MITIRTPFKETYLKLLIDIKNTVKVNIHRIYIQYTVYYGKTVYRIHNAYRFTLLLIRYFFVLISTENHLIV